MGTIFLAILAIVIGGFVRTVGPATGRPGSQGAAKLIISEGLTPAYLTYHYIEQLGTLPSGSVVYVPTEGGVPLMRSLGGGN
jgi:hypothetical protein